MSADLITYTETFPEVRVCTAFVGRDRIVASVRIEHPSKAPIILPASDEDHASRLCSAIGRMLWIAGDAGRAEVEAEYGPRLAAAQLDLLAARRLLAGCEDDQ